MRVGHSVINFGPGGGPTIVNARAQRLTPCPFSRVRRTMSPLTWLNHAAHHTFSRGALGGVAAPLPLVTMRNPPPRLRGLVVWLLRWPMSSPQALELTTQQPPN